MPLSARGGAAVRPPSPRPARRPGARPAFRLPLFTLCAASAVLGGLLIALCAAVPPAVAQEGELAPGTSAGTTADDPASGDLLPLVEEAGEADDSAARGEAELAEIRAEIAELQRDLEAAKRRARGRAGELEQTELELKLQERRTAEAVAARQVAAERAAAAERQLSLFERELDVVRQALRQRLAGLYRLGRKGSLRLLLSAEPGAQVLEAVRMVRYLARRDRQAMDRYEELRSAVASERDELVEHREEVARWTAQEEARRSELVRLRQRQAEALAAAQEERRLLAARAVELAGAEQRLAALLDQLYGRETAPLAGAPIEDFRGVLEWPAEGEVVVGFGPRRDPRYRTEVPHNGVELTTRPGSAVRAIYPGKVLFADALEGYGPTVVVHHAGRVFSLYAGLASLGVGKDDMLSLGQPVGAAAERLYFEIRVDNRPENPLDWLRP